MSRLLVGLCLASGLLTGCPQKKPEYVAPPSEFKRECRRTMPSHRDQFGGFELKIGAGFSDSPNDVLLFRAAAERWKEKTGIALEVTEGHGLKGRVHVHDKLSLCGDARERTDPNWKFADPKSWNEYVYGCYVPQSDEITLSRAAIRKLADNLASDAGSDAVSSQDLYDKIFYWTAMHEIGHWLGLDIHDEKHSGSVMADGGPLQAVIGQGQFDRIKVIDRRRACLLNDCGEDWCSKIKQD